MKSLSIILLILISSCAVSNELNSANFVKDSYEKQNSKTDSIDTPEHYVQIFVRQHIPYCGGAAPTYEQMNSSSPYIGDIILINHQDTTKTLLHSTQNSVYYLNLKPGRYSIQEEYKNVSFSEFRAKTYGIYSQYIVTGGEDCYEQWWKSTLNDFNVTDTTQILIINSLVPNSCYTGTNPCDYYNGPKPP